MDFEEDLETLSALLEVEEEETEYVGELSTQSSGRKRILSESDNLPVAKRQLYDIPSTDERQSTDKGKDDLTVMKAKMEEMERELNVLKKQLKDKEVTEDVLKKDNNEKKVFKQGKRKRTAHEPNGASIKASSPNDIKTKVGVAAIDEKGDTEPYSGLRIKNPLISSQLMHERMKGRKMIQIPQIYHKIKDGDIEGDWVTIGVIIHKLPPRDTAKGAKFSVWKLSDLSSQSSVISLFLFDKVFQEHWKIPVGHVIAILNAKIQTDRETNGSTGVTGNRNYSLSLDHPGKIMSLGISIDFTICQATTLSGKPCSNFANKQHGGRCDYHIQREYSKTRSKRMDCQGGFAPNTLNIHEKVLGRSDVFYQGQWFTSGKEKGKKREDRLFVSSAKEKFTEVEKVLGKDLAGVSGVKKFKDGVMTQSGGEIFKQLLQGQTPGARCYQSHLQKEKIKKNVAMETKKTPLQLLQEHKMASKPNIEDQRKAPSLNLQNERKTPLLNSQSQGKAPSLSSQTDFDLFTPDIILTPDGSKDENVKPPPIKTTPPSTVSIVTAQGKGHDMSTKGTIKRHTPTLKRSQSSIEKEKRAKQIAKEKAIATLSSSDANINKIVARVEANLRKEEEPIQHHGSDLDRSKLDDVLLAKSSHEWAVCQDERDAEDAYFQHLEKKEAIEERLKNLKELTVRLIHCKECNYVAEREGERCHREGHAVSRLRGIKRCFQCSGCGHRHFTYNERYPLQHCHCGEHNFKQTSLHQTRRGPKLPSEELSLRGDEQKFLNSLK